MQELIELRKVNLEEEGVSADLVDSDILHRKGLIRGPVGSPYEGGTFVIDIHASKDHPFRPPRMKFDTKVWHPNVSSQTGAIGLGTLTDPGWSPLLTMRTALVTLQALLSSPDPGAFLGCLGTVVLFPSSQRSFDFADEPQDAVVAEQLKRDPNLWEATAKEWTNKYAKAGQLAEKAHGSLSAAAEKGAGGPR